MQNKIKTYKPSCKTEQLEDFCKMIVLNIVSNILNTQNQMFIIRLDTSLHFKENIEFETLYKHPKSILKNILEENIKYYEDTINEKIESIINMTDFDNIVDFIHELKESKKTKKFKEKNELASYLRNLMYNLIKDNMSLRVKDYYKYVVTIVDEKEVHQIMLEDYDKPIVMNYVEY